MKILQLTGYFIPEKAASMYLVENRLEAFAQEGFETIIHASRPTRGLSDSEYDEYKHKKTETMYEGKLKIHRFSMYREGRNPLLRTLRYSLNWMIQLWLGLKEKDIDCIYLESTPPIQGLLGAILKIIKKVPFVYNLQDIFPDSLAGTSLAKKGGALWKIGRVIENFTYKHADKIIVISEDFKKNIMAKGVPEDKIAVVYNWVDQNAVVDVPRIKNKLFDKYDIDPSQFYIEYSGNIGLTQNMDMLLDVMREFQVNCQNACLTDEERKMYKNIGLVLVGDGACKKQVEEIVKREHLTNVIMLPFQPYKDICHVFSLGDVGLVISKPGVGANSVPSKTWSIMSAARPVLANFDENEMKSILEKNKCGIFTEAGDKEAFKAAITKLYQNRELCRQYGQNGRRFVMENLTKEVGTQKYVDVIKNVVKKKKQIST